MTPWAASGPGTGCLRGLKRGNKKDFGVGGPVVSEVRGGAGRGGASTAVWGNTCVPLDDGVWPLSRRDPGAARQHDLRGGAGHDSLHGDEVRGRRGHTPLMARFVHLALPTTTTPFSFTLSPALCVYNPSLSTYFPSHSLSGSFVAVVSLYLLPQYLPCPALRGSRSRCISLCVSFSTSGVPAGYTRREAPGGVSVSLAAARRAPTHTGWTGSDCRHSPTLSPPPPQHRPPLRATKALLTAPHRLQE